MEKFEVMRAGNTINQGPWRREAGFTLIELLLVLAIFSLSLALVSPYVTKSLSSIKFKATAKNIASTLNYARAKAVRERKSYYVESEKGRFVISAGENDVKKEVRVVDEVVIGCPQGPRVVFYPGGGSSGGEFEVKGTNNDRVLYLIRVEPSTGSVKVGSHSG